MENSVHVAADPAHPEGAADPAHLAVLDSGCPCP